ncbi:hypothetical protein EJ04DRAFT_27957 [Polyplosphaeria fusca]|uniref:Uncharacterized protein n=1 Tax=Polyplosphaeria fusca TaxID=682080 RepID=A0A9P4R503_9PLEO|nr:hypothetical protein EJ04DRAFT_27957 [Polyplosphaeria fusca]
MSDNELGVVWLESSCEVSSWVMETEKRLAEGAEELEISTRARARATCYWAGRGVREVKGGACRPRAGQASPVVEAARANDRRRGSRRPRRADEQRGGRRLRVFFVAGCLRHLLTLHTARRAGSWSRRCADWWACVRRVRDEKSCCSRLTGKGVKDAAEGRSVAAPALHISPLLPLLLGAKTARVRQNPRQTEPTSPRAAPAHAHAHARGPGQAVALAHTSSPKATPDLGERSSA